MTMFERTPEGPFGPTSESESEAERLKKDPRASLRLDKDTEAPTRGDAENRKKEADRTADAILEDSDLKLEDD